jgi:ribosome-binding ATPase
MNLKIAIVGLPNAGKSTLFNALLKKQVAEAANYPFTTIEPNVGVVPVPDDRLEDLAKVIETTDGKKPPLVPAIVEFVDVAGLVKGASEGEGLGNKFLSHIRETNIIVNVLRYFTDPSVVHVAGDVDPKRDKEIIETELILSDMQTLAKQTEPKMNATKEDRIRWELIGTLKKELNEGKSARVVITDDDHRKLVQNLNLLTMKPVLYVANVSEDQLVKYDKLVEFDQFDQSRILPICAKTESELASMTVDEQKTYLHELGLESSGLDRLIKKAYEMLGLLSFLTCGIIESRAWTIAKGTKAPQAAGVIHTDFEKKFIKADICHFDDFVSLGGWTKAREHGKVRSEGKGYFMQDGDVVEFKIGA